MIRNDELYEINNKLDEIRALFYNLLEFDSEVNSEEKSKAKREVRFALNDLLNKADQL